ncbi:MAG: caspase family protein, partial [Rhodoblastus sp.]|nr:caspase family protein [Rhodoblastus sp.]
DARGADVAIIYFAGHGVETGGHNLLLPVDADGSSAEALSNTALPLEDLRDTALSVADTVLIVLDACREDPFLSPASAGGGRGAQRLDVPDLPQGVTTGLGRMGRAENVLYAFAAAPGETASDGEGGHSPFTAALVKYLATDGLEIRSVLTLVQQEVYDATRGRQLPYVESGLPRVFFASTVHEALPERERLLLAMADVTPADRDLVETIAGDYDVPLAPLYAALIGEETGGTNLAEQLRAAAGDYVRVRDELGRLASSDPRVAQLRADAESELALGVFERARDLLSEAAAIDAASRSELKANYVERTLSEAATRFVSGGAGRAELRYDLAVADLEKAVALFAEAGNEIAAGDFDRSLAALQTLGDTYVTVGDITAAETAYANLERRAASRAALDATYRHDLSIARSRLGSARLALGDLPAALEAFRAAIEALDAAPDEMARNGEWRRSRAIVQDKLGAALMTAGDLDGALAAFGDSLAVKLELAESAPADIVALRDLTVTYDALGDLLRVTGRFDEAETAFRASLEARVQLLNARPDDPERARDL